MPSPTWAANWIFEVPAAIHPGAVRHVWDHCVITLRDDTGRRSVFLSLYAIAYSATLGSGNVALLRVDDPAGAMNLVLTDAPQVGARMQERLAGMGHRDVDLRDPPTAATFVRRPLGPDGLGFVISWTSHTVEARWLDPDPPFWMIAPAPDLTDDEDIWAVFVEARRASVTIDGRAVAGAPFSDDAWVPKVGRAMSSAHAALSEVRVTPARGSINGPARAPVPDGRR
jgi:hypothetical protein